MDSGWRTLIVQPHDELSLKNGSLVIRDGETQSAVRLDQVAELLISGRKGQMSLPLMTELARANKTVIFLDEKYNPVGQLLPQGTHFEYAGRLMDQAAWTQRRKDSVWAYIVKQKLANQAALINYLGMPVPYQLNEYAWSVTAGDTDNREGAGARLYFETLFGDGFARREDDPINAALNYGYAILSSAAARAIALCGYSPALGIHHASRQNALNLACDIMEPFRPFVDRIVYMSRGTGFTDEKRLRLISLLQQDCTLDGEQTSLNDALLAFARDVSDAMNNGSRPLREVTLD